MLEIAKRYLAYRPWGPILSFLMLTGFAWGAIWAVIEPFDVPDKISIVTDRWVLHLSASIILGIVATMTLLLLSVSARIPVDYLYETDQAKDFYEKIASAYDSRNSASALQTQTKIVDVITKALAQKGSLKILDLGGGTGRGVAHQFFGQRTIEWVYVEQSLKMFQIFSANVSGANFTFQTYLREIDDFLKSPSAPRFDIILLSLVLSSMPKDPMWDKLADLLPAGGILIVADIDASYTALHPFYIVVDDGKKHGFKPRAIPLTNLIHNTRPHGLSFVTSLPVHEAGKNYSFIAEFHKA